MRGSGYISKKMPIPSGSFQSAFYELRTTVTYRLTFPVTALINTMPYLRKINYSALSIGGTGLITLFLRVPSYL